MTMHWRELDNNKAVYILWKFVGKQKVSQNKYERDAVNAAYERIKRGLGDDADTTPAID